MQRISIVAIAAGAMVLALAGCGQDDSGSAHASHQSTTTAAAPATSKVSTTAAAPIEPPSEAPAADTAPKRTTAPEGAKTTCGDFRELDETTERAVIDQVLAAHPGSILEGNPNAALGTAKLVCLSASYTDTPVAVAIRVADK
ncbi:hypothetical protein JK358_00065 [Nocardia sp. 2]|uniref:DUF4333 domain-containing protein n=1 Tax=Nocardia acididurans TaxID=2802282 RepID=A0ABS1LWW7_9NOCA|nr:hypothetical protein [Nocardia acididurans]MBL1072782.1 hypothetical protein [Nocardia acididurans]